MFSVCSALFTRDNLGALVLDMLFLWARGQKNAGPGAVSRLVDAMIESGRRDVADEIQDIVRIGRRKYSESLRRVGLEGESSTVSEHSSRWARAGCRWLPYTWITCLFTACLHHPTLLSEQLSWSIKKSLFIIMATCWQHLSHNLESNRRNGWTT